MMRTRARQEDRSAEAERRSDGGEAHGRVRSPVEWPDEKLGNQAVQDLVEEGVIQPKLEVGAPDDEYEEEAERVAEAVTGMCPRCRRRHRDGVPLDCEECEEELRRNPESGSRPDGLRRAGRADVSADVAKKIEALRGGGRPLSRSARAFFEPRFGENFSGVHVHTTDRAHAVARAVGAEAFSIEDDIFFRSGRYRPGSDRGRRLLAHELTHVLQQRRGNADQIVQRQGGDEGRDASGDRQGEAESQDVRVEFNAFIPDILGEWFWEPTPGLPEGSTNCQAHTDDRGFGEQGTSRIHKEGRLTLSKTGLEHCVAGGDVGESKRRCLQYPLPAGRRGPESPATGSSEEAPGRGRFGPPERKTARSAGSESGSCGKCRARFDFVGAARYPFISMSPQINFDVTAVVRATAQGVTVKFSGTHDDFPGYEGVVEIGGRRDLVYRYWAGHSGPSPWNLGAKAPPVSASESYDASPVPIPCMASFFRPESLGGADEGEGG